MLVRVSEATEGPFSDPHTRHQLQPRQQVLHRADPLFADQADGILRAPLPSVRGGGIADHLECDQESLTTLQAPIRDSS